MAGDGYHRDNHRPSARLIWGTVGLAVFVLLWFWGSTRLGPIALPSPLETGSAVVALVGDGRALTALAGTGFRVLTAFAVAIALGGGLGLAAGLLPPLRHAIGPLVTMLLAVPPVAWIVLALLWFGTGGVAVVFTVVVALLPIPFLAAVQGVRTVDPGLMEMARAFRLSLRSRLEEIILPHLLSHLLPAVVTTFGLAWKVTVMAELLGAREGVGSGLAGARANLDTAESFAWIAIVVTAFVAVEVGLIRPFLRRLQPWRQKDRSMDPGAAQ